MSASAFVATRSQHIPSLNIEFQEYRHEPTGARHFHLACDDTNNAFLVAFLTVPQDSTGVAHILEHTSLCGSRRFPVRDPFFMMIRRSLNTFMNAFTASDWTAYPFASKNRKDFDNLLEVYLDAAFFPRLDPLDFAQEGHRVELTDPDDPGSPLLLKGVVYNEMKGAMSSPVSQVAEALQERLFPTTTYHYNSGGDPAEIPNLTHEALRAFHARHYHPSNALFMTYGSFPCAEHQSRMDDLALAHFQRLDHTLEIPDERRYDAPLVAYDSYSLESDEDPSAKAHTLLGWLLGRSTDLHATMRARVLAGVLLDNSASPLRHVLETTGLGTAPSELCGLDDSTREATFACGLEGSEAQDAEAIERLILDKLEEVARDGVEREVVESVIHQVELAQREVGGGGFPYGLQLMVRALSPALYGADPGAALDLDPVLEQLREESHAPRFIPDLVTELLLENPHRVRLTMTPDPELAKARAKAEQERLSAVRDALSPAEMAGIVEQARALKLRQDSEDDPELLPKVGIEDIPPDLVIPEGSHDSIAARPVSWYLPGTNGLVYVQLVAELPDLGPEEIELLPTLCDVFTDVGCGERDYLTVQAWQAAVTGGVRARTSVRARPEDVNTVGGYFVLAAKSLARNQAAMVELLDQTFAHARFDELSRLRELTAQSRVHAESQITDHGHSLAIMAAGAGMSPCGALEHEWGGLSGLRALKALDDELDDADALARLAESLSRLHARLRDTPVRILAVTEEVHQAALAQSLERIGTPTGRGGAPFQPRFEARTVREAWTTNTQVSFCARAHPAVSQAHADAPALRVLGPYLRNGWLHRAIREQGGAYGAGAGYSPDTASFRFYSYRDPRLAGTLADFDRSVRWLLDSKPSARLLEEAVLGVIGEIDRPDSPAGEAVIAYFGELHGRDARQRREFRQAVLEVGLDDLRAVTERYLTPDNASTAVLTSAGILESEAAADEAVAALSRESI